MKTLATGTILGLVVLLAAGCDAGPVGPQGPPGNANVFSLNFTFFLESENRVGAVFSEQYDVPAITPPVVDDGAVLVYYRFADTWTALPFTVGVEAPDDPPRVDYTATFGYGFDDSFLEVFVEASSEDDVVWEELEQSDLFAGTLDMKAVIIEGFALGKRHEVDLRDYEAVKAYFGLKD